VKKYGFLGLGIMGQAMAANLLKADFEVTVWNRTTE
jgi:3-hydroxyisobutyrate dehydrogenase-like beta-hydroxyacid dehydrogenase